jgi:hypothetical protein
VEDALAHYEYRRYSVTPGKMDQLLARFEEATLAIWDDLGLRPAGFWQSDVGRSSDLHYLLAWDSLDDRAEKLRAFRADPRWAQARADTEQDGPLIQYADNQLWPPAIQAAGLDERLPATVPDQGAGQGVGLHGPEPGDALSFGGVDDVLDPGPAPLIQSRQAALEVGDAPHREDAGEEDAQSVELPERCHNEPADALVGRAVLDAGGGEGRFNLADDAVERSLEERLAGGEVVVDRAECDVGPLRHRSHGHRIGPVLEHEVEHGADQLFAGRAVAGAEGVALGHRFRSASP